MFSSSSSSGGGGAGGNGGGGGGGCGCGGNGGGDGGSSGMKKPHKRPKVPKRGPGVAELEKILREQEMSQGGVTNDIININNTSNSNSIINNNNKNNNHSNGNVEGFSNSHAVFPPPPPPPPPMPVVATPRPRPQPPSSSHDVPIVPRFDQLSTLPPLPPPLPSASSLLYGFNAPTQQGRNLLEKPFFPMNSSSMDGLSQPPHDNNNHHHLHHSANSSSKSFYSDLSNGHNHLWSSHSALPHKRPSTPSSNQYSSPMVNT